MPATAPFPCSEKPFGFFNVPVAAATKLWAGAMVALNAAGAAVPAADTAGLRVIGRSEATVDNSAGAAGDLRANVKRGVFQYLNDATNPVTPAMVGLPCFVKDDITVTTSAAANDIKAGVVVGVDAEGVWVDTTLATAI